ncbi:Aste57867_11908 [Aphanomyces stellatus]|uniref:Aste57867_11908 protein n=1 Tax=Aphanomyces stellatus TaxID=120398 RepID=A0A485KW67_9STRA|nr:hypothetical protein As57867_011863 [Aphanomyces stellatus]VFT88763.1 Aste57867_11908 [Aphanomyces stellatus]
MRHPYLLAAVFGFASALSLDELLQALPDEPRGYGEPCSNRDYWQPILDANVKFVDKTRNDARKQLDTNMPAWSDADYLLYSQTGNRDVGQTMMRNRHTFVRNLVLAECFDMDGTFLAKAEAALVDYATQKTWVLAAHDAKLDVFYGRAAYVDLNAALVSSFLGSTLYMLDDVLSDTTKEMLRTELSDRTVQPLLDRLKGESKPFWWQTSDSNWNAVCFNGMATAILTTVADKADRAAALLTLVDQSQGYLKSFFDDGYGSEGVSYFNYGFGEFAELREKLCDATAGVVDLFDVPKVGRMAHAPRHFAMRNGKLAGFGDARLDSTFSTPLLQYIAFAYGESDDVDAPIKSSLPGTVMNLAFPVTKPTACRPLSYDDDGTNDDLLRHVFDKAQVVVLRGNDDSKFDLTFKVTGNGGHSHNDIGSYEIVFGDEYIMGDAGGPSFYEARTFDKRRYLSPLMNSYGHPVPVVAGKNQSEAVAVQKKNKFQLTTDFTPSMDIVSTNLAAAYDVKTLATLKRTVSFDRTDLGSIAIEDAIAMKDGATVDFESVFTVLGNWTATSDATGVVTTASGAQVKVSITASSEFTVSSKVLSDYKLTWTRVAVKVSSDNSEEFVTVTIQPESTPCNDI